MKQPPKKLWFKRRLFGWGWTPCSWEGWVFIGLYLVIIIGFAMWFENKLETDPWIFVLVVILTILIVIAVGYWKGEKPKWQWGTRRD